MGCHRAVGAAEGIGLAALRGTGFVDQGLDLWAEDDLPDDGLYSGVFIDDTCCLAHSRAHRG